MDFTLFEKYKAELNEELDLSEFNMKDVQIVGSEADDKGRIADEFKFWNAFNAFSNPVSHLHDGGSRLQIALFHHPVPLLGFTTHHLYLFFP